MEKNEFLIKLNKDISKIRNTQEKYAQSHYCVKLDDLDGEAEVESDGHRMGWYDAFDAIKKYIDKQINKRN